MNLTTSYLGLELRNPLVASAGPLSQTVEGIKSLAAGGAGAVVMFSLFEEQLRKQLNDELDLLESYEESFAEATSYFPDVAIPDDASIAADYLRLISDAASQVDVPIIGSLNGADLGGWVSFAQKIEDAGAAALELNIYATPAGIGSDGDEIIARHPERHPRGDRGGRHPRRRQAQLLLHLCRRLGPHDPGRRGVRGGAVHRFLQPDIDTETLTTVPGVDLSTPVDGRLPRTWIANPRAHTPKSLALTSGVETADDVVKGLLAGADVVMTTSALIRHGAGYSGLLLDDLGAWMTRKGFDSVGDFRGLLAAQPEASGSAWGRAGYVADLQTAKTQYAV